MYISHLKVYCVVFLHISYNVSRIFPDILSGGYYGLTTLQPDGRY